MSTQVLIYHKFRLEIRECFKVIFSMLKGPGGTWVQRGR